MSRTTRSAPALLAAFLLSLTACGSTSADEASSAPSASESAPFPVTVTGADGELTIEEQPDAIVSLSATTTEMLFAIGAGDQVTAVDDNSNYPPDAPITDLSAFTPNAEAIAGYEPDLVILSNDMNGIVDALDALAIPTLLLEAGRTIDDTYAQLETLGDATGHAEEADEVIADVRDRIAAAVESVPDDAQGMKVFHELDPSFFSADSSTFIGSIYAEFGLENIADGVDDAAGGYPQLSAEYIVGEEPDLIVLADTKCCEQSAETVAQRPAFGTIPAVKDERILAADDDVASRWGPRIAEFAEAVAETLQN
ncbi:ABC transporter substrate-binding protein [Blastococcus sp. PRF04-17]|uniref:ABC transporter substrate-binding protein n=1 Tax=Blastococcus sp. PRF04-17 TaxID=2933797 RepID=UPI001FF4CD35|nr:ABC transporter substrate-binding protein [Blastococcus sp. PRF04-17]UOY03794.1 ABC transporter substrate-binding protein [Blastococcus sp. PRF04-17]